MFCRELLLKNVEVATQHSRPARMGNHDIQVKFNEKGLQCSHQSVFNRSLYIILDAFHCFLQQHSASFYSHFNRNLKPVCTLKSA